MVKISCRTEHLAYIHDVAYKSFPAERFIATNVFLNPTLMIRDIQVIKKIAVKDFEHFLNHEFVVDEEVEPYLARNLMALKGQEWKDMRSTLSPVFTSSKIRLMVSHILDICDQTTTFLKQAVKANGNIDVDVDVKDLLARHTVDVIASCVYGYKVNSHVDRSNEFYDMAVYITSTTFDKMLRFLCWMIFPKFMKKFKIGLLTSRARSFFKSLVFNAISKRTEENLTREDMINILMQAKEGTLTNEEIAKDVAAGFAMAEESDLGKKKHNRVWSDDDLIAQGLLFFFAGAETSSAAVTFLLFELAQNPDVQERLSQEIRDHEKNNAKLDYSSLQDLKYLDMVISEVLRLWPPAAMTDRICTKTCNLGKPNEGSSQEYLIQPGEAVLFPIWSIHRDPQYFRDPEKFDPERFSDENKHEIEPFSYIPFGVGPRNCIGSRFALCQVKILVYKLLLDFIVMPCSRTRLPVELSGENIHLRIKGGHMLRFKLRI